MSDSSQGPGWWIASDGKWYAPHLHPDFRPPPPPLSGPFPTEGGPPTSAPVVPTYGYDPDHFSDPVLRLPLAPWWKRLVAIFVDMIVIGSAFGVVIVLLAIVAPHHPTTPPPPSKPTPHADVWVGLVSLWIGGALLTSIYYGAMNGSRRGQTVGKLALSIAVRNARTGERIGFWRAYFRYFVTALFAIAFYVPFILDCLWPLWDRRRQALHDKVVHSIVVDLRP